MKEETGSVFWFEESALNSENPKRLLYKKLHPPPQNTFSAPLSAKPLPFIEN